MRGHFQFTGEGSLPDPAASVVRPLTVALAAVVLLSSPGPLLARTLADQLAHFITDNSFFLQNGIDFDSLTPTLERIAVQGTSLPATATVPDVTYVYDPELGIPVRSSGVPGTVFLESAETVGPHALLLGMAYQHADLDQLDGQDAASNLAFTNSVPATNTMTGQQLRVRNRFEFSHFAIHLDDISFSGTFGLTKDWDVNVLLPLLRTELDARATSQNFTVYPHERPIPDRPASLQLQGDAVGIGDVLLRTKYRIARTRLIDVASALVVRVPAGEEENFQGLGDWTVTPLLILSHGVGPHDLHANLAMELNADKLARSRVRYGLGATVRMKDWLAAFVDLIGSSGIETDRFTESGTAPPGSRFAGPFQTSTATAAPDGSVHVVTTVPRTDVLDLAVGLKFALVGRATGFVSAIVPLTSDGLRAPVVPAGGIEYLF